MLDSFGKCIGEGLLEGFQMWDVGRYPGIVAWKDGVVVGDLVDISAKQHMLKALDEYKGIGGVYEEPFEFKREVCVLARLDASLCCSEDGLLTF